MSAAFLASALIQFALALFVAWILGPGEFGVYALALSAAILGQTLLFEWLRLAATRFHVPGGCGVQKRLARAMIWFGGIAVLLSIGLYLAPFERRGLLALLPLLALTAGLADFRAALMRAEFNTRRYAAFMLARNGFAVCLMPLAAFRFGHAEAGVAAFLAALVSSILVDWLWFRRRQGEPGEVARADVDLAGAFAYAAPIVATNGLYLLMFFMLRAGIAFKAGVAEVGLFALPLEFALKLFTTIGSALDLLLFQLAVRDSRDGGRVAGEDRLARNGEIVLAILMPMALGLFLVVPGLEVWLVGPEFRGAFAVYLSMLLPGIAGYALVQYALHPHLQLRLQTLPLIGAAVAAGTTAGVIFGVGAYYGLSLPLLAGLALGVGMAAAIGILAVRIGRLAWPGLRYLLSLMAGLAAMTLAVRGAGHLAPGNLVLFAEIGAGAAAYATVAFWLDLAGFRGLIRERKALARAGRDAGS